MILGNACLCCALLLWSLAISLRPPTGAYVFKKLARDFVVVEDGVLRRLDYKHIEVTEVETPADAAASGQRVSQWLSDSQLQTLHDLVSEERPGASTTLDLIPALTKAERTELHQHLKCLFPTLESKTDKTDSEETTKILVFRKGAKILREEGEKKGKRVVQFWDSKRPNYLHFSAQKSYMSTSELISALARQTGLLPSRFSYAGQKDKRATTAQRLAVWRLDRETLLKASSLRVKNADVKVYDVVPEKEKLNLGQLEGNLFCVTLRRSNLVTVASPPPSPSSVEEASRAPFVNLFGPQRFGSPLPINAHVGRSLLCGDYRRAVLLLLLAPLGEMEVDAGLDLPTLLSWVDRVGGSGGSVEEFLADCWAPHVVKVRLAQQQLVQKVAEEDLEGDDIDPQPLEGDSDGDEDEESSSPLPVSYCEERLAFTAALLRCQVEGVRLPKKLPFEIFELFKNLVHAAQQAPSGGFCALDFQALFSSAYSKSMKQLFVNSLQSEVWNAWAASRFAKSAKVVAGDVVIAISGDSGGGGTNNWESQAVSNANDLTTDSSPHFLHIVTDAEAAAEKYSLDSVVLPLPGLAVSTELLPRLDELPQDLADAAAVLCGSSKTAARPPALFRVPGSWRHMATCARNFACIQTNADGLEVPVPAPAQTSQSSQASFTTLVDELAASGRLQTYLCSLLKASSNDGDAIDHEGKEGHDLRLLFSLPSSSYATVFLKNSLGLL